MIGTYYREGTFTFDNYSSRAFDTYFSGKRIAVLDIETTGLSPDSAHFVLGSLLALGDGEAWVLPVDVLAGGLEATLLFPEPPHAAASARHMISARITAIAFLLFLISDLLLFSKD